MAVDPEQVRKLVFEALDNGVAGGHGNEMRQNTVSDEAINLLDYDGDISQIVADEGDIFGVPDLLPHIEAWAKARNFTFKPER